MTADYSLISNIAKDVTFNGVYFIIGTFAVFLVIILITRDKSKWGKLAFPVAILLHTVGIEQSIILFILTAIVYVQSHLGLDNIGGIVSMFGGGRIVKEPEFTYSNVGSERKLIKKKSKVSLPSVKYTQNTNIKLK